MSMFARIFAISLQARQYGKGPQSNPSLSARSLVPTTYSAATLNGYRLSLILKKPRY